MNTTLEYLGTILLVLGAMLFCSCAVALSIMGMSFSVAIALIGIVLLALS